MPVKKTIASLSSIFVLLVQVALAVTVLATSAWTQTPVGLWKFDDGSGTKATDSSDSGHTASLINDVSWITGKVDGAVSAKAENKQFATIPAIDLSATNAVTIALWSNRSYSTDGGHVLFESTTNFNNSTSGFVFLPDDDTCHGISVALHGNVGYTTNCYSQPSSGVWHHLAVVFDKSQTGGNEVAFYVDGILQTPIRNLQASTNTDDFGNNPIYLFSRAGTTYFDSGMVDDFRVYSSALTAAQIQQIYSGKINSGKTLVSLKVTPANASIASGEQQQFIATGTYADGSKKDLTSSANWASSTASAGTISGPGLAVAVAAGNTTIRATVGSVKGSAGLIIIGSTLVSIAVTPVNPSITTGQQQQFTATGTYSNGSKKDLTSSAAWSSSATSVATISSSGLATAVAAGSTTIKATSGSVNGSTTLTVTAPTLVSIAVTPVNPSLSVGQQQQFTATGTYSDGSKKDLTSSAAWSSSATSVATISSSGLATAVAAGSTTIKATSGSVNGSTTLTVTAPTLVSIAVTPVNPSLSVGQQQQFTATGTYSDGSKKDLTSSAAWSSSATPVATISSSGLATAVAAGSTSIKATSGSINGSASLTVSAPTLVSIAVTPVNPSLSVGQQQQFTATGTYSDGSKKDLTSSAAWSSSATSVATISSSGLTTAVAAGSTTIKATSGSVNGSTSLTVTAPTLVSIAVTPVNPSLSVGQQQQFTATGTYSDGSKKDLTSTATWTSSATSVATISSSGLATAAAAGSTTIKATSGSVSGSTSLTVTGVVQTSYTIWQPTTTPVVADSGDGGSVELGVKFRADYAGYITGLRFYKANKNVGTHIGNIWTTSGNLLGTATFTNETASGWQQVWFNNPIPVAANTVYVASYFAPAGHYSDDDGYFASKGVDNPPLHALANGVSGANGVYVYHSTSAFPTTGYLSTNYWVDVVYTTSSTYSISGTISGAGGAGATVSMTGAQTATTTADASGNYTFAGLGNGSYIITPSNTGVTFSPPSQTVTINGASVTGVNFTATLTNPFSISGTISGAGGAGATVNLTGAKSAAATADGSGNYSFTGLANGSYTVTPSKSGYSYTPASQAVTVNGASVTGVNFTSTGQTYGISGTISGAGGAGATVNLTGAKSAAATADGSGNYSFTGLANGSYTVTPSKSGYSYTPASQAVTVNGASVTGVNFTSTGQTYGISGTISGAGGAGATVNLTGAKSAAATADGSGNYSFTGLANGSYTVTPSKSGYSYTPASRAVTVNGASVGSVNFSSVVQSHWVDLSWTASISPVIGYNIYRSNTSGGPYSKLNSTLNSSTSYSDSSVLSGYTYYYVTTAVDAQLNESVYSNESFATVP